MHSSLSLLALLGLTLTGAIPATTHSEPTKRQSLTVGQCASVSTTLDEVVPYLLYGTTGGLVGSMKAILAAAPGVATVHVFPASGCAGQAADIVVTTAGDVVGALVDAVDAVGDKSFTITV